MSEVQVSIQVARSTAEAFLEFTLGMDAWWPPAGRGADAPQVFIEPHAGGRWYERDANRIVCPWGRVLVWEPPHRVTLSWQIGADGEFDAGLETLIEVNFVALSTSACRVSLHHRQLERYGEAAAAQQSLLGSNVGWLGVLEAFSRCLDAALPARPE